MSKKTRTAIDERATRTRNALATALIDLGGRMSVDDIDVRMLTKHAGIGRSTFYAHFTSFGDYLSNAYANMLEMNARFDAAQEGAVASALHVRSILNHIHAARTYALAVNQSRHRPRMLAAGEDRLRIIVEANLRSMAPGWPEAKRAQAAVFIAGGFMGLLRWWTDGGLTETPAAMEAAFQELSDKVLTE